MMPCPICGKSMVALEFHGVELDHCLHCGGVWLDRGELGVLLAGDPAYHPEWKLQGGAAGSKTCPHCTRKLAVVPLRDSNLEVDVCTHEHGLWLDAGELEKLGAATPASPQAARVLEFCREVFGATKK